MILDASTGSAGQRVLYWGLCNCRLVISNISWELGVGSAISMKIISDFKNFSNLCLKIDESTSSITNH